MTSLRFAAQAPSVARGETVVVVPWADAGRIGPPARIRGMGFKDFFKGLFAEPERKVSFRGLPNEEIERLWSERAELTDEAAEELRREVARRGLELADSPPPKSDEAIDAEIAAAYAEEEEYDALMAAQGGMVISFGADGSTRIGSGRDQVVLNEPRSDDDGRPRSTDGLAVARRFLEACGDRPLEAPLPLSFVDAAMVAARAGDSMPSFGDEARTKLGLLTWCAALGDVDRALERDGDEIARNAVLTRTHPAALLAKAPQHLGAIVRAMAADEALATEHLTAMAEADIRDPVLVEATLVAMDHGLDPEPFLKRWRDPDTIDDEKKAHFWRAAEVRRTARVDLKRALELEEALPGLWSHDEHASIAVAARLARVDPGRAFERAIDIEPDLDQMGWLRGCSLGKAARMGELLDRWIEHLGPMTYDPHFFMLGVLETCIEQGDPVRARRLLENGGPTSWQVAHAAHDALARCSDPEPFLEVLLDRYEPGAVAGRAVERHGFPLAAGKVVIRPAWLDFHEPHPVETLSVTAALAGQGPIWSWDWLP